MEISFEGKKILVTGAGQGIGRELCKRLVLWGANVVGISRTATHLQSLKQEIDTQPKHKEGGSYLGLVCDVTDWDGARRLVTKEGPFDALVNNAAVAILEPFLQATLNSFDRIFDANVKAVFNLSQVVAKEMIAANIKGSIVNISSQAAHAALEDHALYCSSKGAVELLTKVMGVELGCHGIRVNTVCPTVVLTAMGRLGWSSPDKAQPMLNKIPLHRFAEVSEVVDAIVYLLSENSSMVNCAALPVDGGFLAC